MVTPPKSCMMTFYEIKKKTKKKTKVGAHVRLVGVRVASVRVFGNQHVGIGNACLRG